MNTHLAPLFLLLTASAAAQVWVGSTGGTVPANAVSAGIDHGGQSLYICRTTYQGIAQIGKTAPHLGGCRFEMSGAAVAVASGYEVLTNFSAGWRSASGGNVPAGSYDSGYGYICRASLNNSVQVGKVAGGNRCYLEYSGRSVFVAAYEVLWEPWINATSGTVPAGSLQTGTDINSVPLYTCRALVADTHQIGKVKPGINCRVNNGSAYTYYTTYQVLAGGAASWSPGANGSTTSTFAAGLLNGVLSKYACRAQWTFPTPSVQPGQLGPASCLFEFAELVRGVTPYEVLDFPNTVNTSCTSTLSATSANAPAAASTASVGITLSAGDCGWYATPNDGWITITNSPQFPNTSYSFGTGTGAVNYSTEANLSYLPRTGTITINSKTFTIIQAGTPPVCTYSLNPGATVVGIPANGGTQTVEVTAPAGCPWTASSNAGWLGINSGASGMGSGSVNYGAGDNRSGLSRSGIITIAGIAITVNQSFCTATLIPTSTSLPATAGSGSFSVSTNCTWSPVSNDAWITVTSGGNVGVGGPVTFNVQANLATSARTGTISAAGQTFTVNQSAATCIFSLSAPGVTIPPSGGPASVNVTTNGPSCAWTTTAPDAWLTITAGAAGSGNGTVGLSVTANPNATVRSSTLTIAGQTFTVIQAAGGCTFSLAATTVSNIPYTAGTFTMALTANGTTCIWSASANDPWLSLAGTSAGGSGSANIVVITAANPNASTRTGTVTIAGIALTVIQNAAPCTYSLASSSVSVPSSGGSGSAMVATNGPSCAWTATSNNSWLSVVSGASSTGNGSTNFAAQPNLATEPRAGSLTVAGQTFTVTQAATGCSFTLDTNVVSIAAAGGTALVAVTAAGANCSWMAVSPEAFVVIVAGSAGTGSGVVTLNILANPSASSRSALLTIAGQTVAVNQAGTQTGGQTTGLRFVPLDPCRVMETRPEYNYQGRTGAFGPPFVNRGDTRTLNLPQSTVCQIPAIAKAYVLNVTLIPRNGAGVDFVTVYPAGETRPAFWTVRSPDAQIVANSAIVKAGVSGGISVYAADSTDMIIDISGYFTDDANTPGFTYYPLTPCRVLDTRTLYRLPPGPFGPPSMNAGERRSFALPQATQYCQVPSGAKAYSLTITVAPPGALQFLTAWPTGGPQPNVSSINSPAGRTLANSVILPASSTGSIDVFVFDRSDVLLDITGYFADDNGQGLFYFPVPQCRASDSQFNDEQTKSINLTTCSGVPGTAKGYAANVTSISAGSPMPFLTLYPTGQPRPNASTLNAFEGQTITNSTIVPSGANAAIDVFAYRRTQVVLEISGYFGR